MSYPHALVAVFAAAMLSLLAAPTQAQHNQARLITNNRGANVVIQPSTHPAVAVSPSLDAQPVHPHKVKLVLPGRSIDQATMHTWVDPDARLDRGSRGLHHNHSIVRALRQARKLRSGGAKLIQPDRGAAVYRTAHGAQSHARLIVGPTRPSAAPRGDARPFMILQLPGDRDEAPAPAKPRPGSIVSR